MKLAWISLVAGAAASALAVSALASEPVYLGDIKVVHQPPPSGYQPEGTNFDLEDQGKTFDISCTIAADGRLTACEAAENNLYDQNFVDIATANISQWIVAPQTVTGEPSAGRSLIVTVQFNRADRTDVAAADDAK